MTGSANSSVYNNVVAGHHTTIKNLITNRGAALVPHEGPLSVHNNWPQPVYYNEMSIARVCTSSDFGACTFIILKKERKKKILINQIIHMPSFSFTPNLEHASKCEIKN
jgi:hypothetical protein